MLPTMGALSGTFSWPVSYKPCKLLHLRTEVCSGKKGGTNLPAPFFLFRILSRILSMDVIAYTFRLDTRGCIMCSLVSHALAAMGHHYCGASLR